MTNNQPTSTMEEKIDNFLEYFEIFDTEIKRKTKLKNTLMNLFNEQLALHDQSVYAGLREKIEEMEYKNAEPLTSEDSYNHALEDALALLDPETHVGIKQGCQTHPRSSHVDLPKGIYCNHCEDQKGVK